MSFTPLLRRWFLVLLPLAVTSTIYLYLYPAFNGCAFPTKDGLSSTALWNTLNQHTYHDGLQPDSLSSESAPFRLLVLADPQLEGDSSLPDPKKALIPSLRRHWHTLTNYTLMDDDEDERNLIELIKEVGREVVYNDIPRSLKALRKQLDLFGNDYYLAHIYRALHWWTIPTHVTVLGDLIGSQWVTDDEFSARGRRYWDRVFRKGEKIGSSILEQSITPEPLDRTKWNKKIINIVGNHDVGYAGDISENRMDRFEEVFGPPNWDIRFLHDPLKTVQPSIHVIVVNSLSLDGPPLVEDIQSETYDYINSVISTRSYPVEDRTSFTLLLTHLPLHKPAGVCVDPPHMTFQTHDDKDGRFKEGGLREQNHLSEHVSTNGMLEGIFGMSGDKSVPAEGKGRAGLILTGHDHEGCDVWHHVPSSPTPDDAKEGEEVTSTSKQPWRSIPFAANLTSPSHSHTGIREITLRSMMGQYDGNAGLLSLWFDFDAGEWRYGIQMCRLGVQHIWWAVHVLDLVTLIVGSLWFVTSIYGFTVAPTRHRVVDNRHVWDDKQNKSEGVRNENGKLGLDGK